MLQTINRVFSQSTSFKRRAKGDHETTGDNSPLSGKDVPSGPSDQRPDSPLRLGSPSIAALGESTLKKVVKRSFYSDASGGGEPLVDGRGGTGKEVPTEMLAFEIGSIMRRMLEIFDSMSEKMLSSLRANLQAPGVVTLISSDLRVLWGLAGYEKHQELRSVACRVAVLGRKCRESRLHRLERLFARLDSTDADYKMFSASSAEGEVLLRFMREQAEATSELKNEMESIQELHSRIQEYGEWNSLQEMVTQGKLVEKLQGHCLWAFHLDYLVQLLIIAACYVRKKIFASFGHGMCPPRIREACLGEAGLALHYANVVVLLERIIQQPDEVLGPTRDELYEMLPRNIQYLLRVQLQDDLNFQADGRVEANLKRGLLLLPTMAHNTITWHSLHTPGSVLDSNETVFQVQTFYFANLQAVNATLVDVLLGLCRICGVESAIGCVSTQIPASLDYSQLVADKVAEADRHFRKACGMDGRDEDWFGGEVTKVHDDSCRSRLGHAPPPAGAETAAGLVGVQAQVAKVLGDSSQTKRPHTPAPTAATVSATAIAANAAAAAAAAAAGSASGAAAAACDAGACSAYDGKGDRSTDTIYGAGTGTSMVTSMGAGMAMDKSSSTGSAGGGAGGTSDGTGSTGFMTPPESPASAIAQPPPIPASRSDGGGAERGHAGRREGRRGGRREGEEWKRSPEGVSGDKGGRGEGLGETGQGDGSRAAGGRAKSSQGVASSSGKARGRSKAQQQQQQQKELPRAHTSPAVETTAVAVGGERGNGDTYGGGSTVTSASTGSSAAGSPSRAPSRPSSGRPSRSRPSSSRFKGTDATAAAGAGAGAGVGAGGAGASGGGGGASDSTSSPSRLPTPPPPATYSRPRIPSSRSDSSCLAQQGSAGQRGKSSSIRKCSSSSPQADRLVVATCTSSSPGRPSPSQASSGRASPGQASACFSPQSGPFLSPAGTPSPADSPRSSPHSSGQGRGEARGTAGEGLGEGERTREGLRGRERERECQGQEGMDESKGRSRRRGSSGCNGSKRQGECAGSDKGQSSSSRSTKSSSINRRSTKEGSSSRQSSTSSSAGANPKPVPPSSSAVSSSSSASIPPSSSAASSVARQVSTDSFLSTDSDPRSSSSSFPSSLPSSTLSSHSSALSSLPSSIPSIPSSVSSSSSRSWGSQRWGFGKSKSVRVSTAPSTPSRPSTPAQPSTPPPNGLSSCDVVTSDINYCNSDTSPTGAGGDAAAAAGGFDGSLLLSPSLLETRRLRKAMQGGAIVGCFTGGGAAAAVDSESEAEGGRRGGGGGGSRPGTAGSRSRGSGERVSGERVGGSAGGGSVGGGRRSKLLGGSSRESASGDGGGKVGGSGGGSTGSAPRRTKHFYSQPMPPRVQWNEQMGIVVGADGTM
ncbi:hypothetical protein CLOM_g7539 [Closterium sp. NIES-68]|nr:hypothetical protein CLOM_g7539 [Closterium sp. NIES-68]GJP80348.1 hypothetical protein CLOP_g10561 [Closterium sp. NIES-67]